MISFVSSFEIINVVQADPKVFFRIVASFADNAAVHPNGIKTLLASNSLSTCFIKGKPIFTNGPKILSKNHPDCPILCNSVFVNFILADETFAKALGSLETCVLVNNNLYEKI